MHAVNGRDKYGHWKGLWRSVNGPLQGESMIGKKPRYIFYASSW